ncbi:MAG: TraB family protein [Calditrichaeota bacterium]|nr:MAG: TraB family protein [Calditrichota bacterium]
MPITETTQRNYPEDVQIVKIRGREFILIGTAHISQESADLVRQVVENEKPDCVCVELDAQRYKALSQKQKWEELDLKSVIRQKQLATLLINLLLGSYQKRLGEKLGVTPGLELLEATKVADENGIPIALCDRDIRITLRRAWNSMSFWKKMQFMSSGLVGVLENPEISEKQLSEIKQKDVLNELMQELGAAMPVLKQVLIDERDTYLTQKMLAAEGEKIVAVVGAGHVSGIIQSLENHQPRDLAEIEIIPPVSPAWKWVGWGIPVLIIASIVYIGFQKGPEAAGDNALYWIIANGLPSMIGTIIALAHPITIISAFVAAPFTSLTPVIGAGYVTAFVQAYFKPPVVREFQSVSKDFSSPAQWWQNKLLRIFLVFILSGIGSMIGTWVGAVEIFSNLF